MMAGAACYNKKLNVHRCSSRRGEKAQETAQGRVGATVSSYTPTEQGGSYCILLPTPQSRVKLLYPPTPHRAGWELLHPPTHPSPTRVVRKPGGPASLNEDISLQIPSSPARPLVSLGHYTEPIGSASTTIG